MNDRTGRLSGRLCPLADSLPGAIRWRFSDYEQMLAKQLRILAPPLRLVWPPRAPPRSPTRE
jgi:hypothetical protein